MGKLTAQMIFEILGRPPENVTNSLKELSEKIGKEKEEAQEAAAHCGRSGYGRGAAPCPAGDGAR